MAESQVSAHADGFNVISVFLMSLGDRAALREPMAEFIGAALILIFGAGAGCSVVLAGHPDIAGASRGVSICLAI